MKTLQKFGGFAALYAGSCIHSGYDGFSPVMDGRMTLSSRWL